MDWEFLATVAFRAVLALVIGALIGSERAKHGRSAGIRTHILVCLGAALTSMIGTYVGELTGDDSGMLRMSAQVISGIGFLGAGMIIVKSNDQITGLTTAAGVWTASIVGIAVGYGFYVGAVVTTLLFLTTTVLFAKLERRKKRAVSLYVEIDDTYQTNRVVRELKERLGSDVTYKTMAAKSGCPGHLGLHLLIEKRPPFEMETLCECGNVVYVEEE